MRGGGAHGPPRCSEVSWWGPGHRRSQWPPVPGTAPLTLAKQVAKTSIEPQKPIGPALCRLFLTPEKTQTGTRQDGRTVLQLTYIQMQQIHPHNALARSPVESRCPGEPTRRGLGRSSPCLMAADSNRNSLKRFENRKPNPPLYLWWPELPKSQTCKPQSQN